MIQNFSSKDVLSFHVNMYIPTFLQSKKEEEKNPSFRRKKLTAEDEVRILHEAYQFLLRKFDLGSTSGSVGGEEEIETAALAQMEWPKQLWGAVDKKANENEDKDKLVDDNEEDNDDVFENTKSEDEDLERQMELGVVKNKLKGKPTRNVAKGLASSTGRTASIKGRGK